MTQHKPKMRSRTVRRVFVKVPGNRVALHYRPQKPKQASCSKCAKPLHGIPRLHPTVAHHTAKTKKRPERPFAGQLCTVCMRRVFREKAGAL